MVFVCQMPFMGFHYYLFMEITFFIIKYKEPNTAKSEKIIVNKLYSFIYLLSSH